jgi:hypothetical protein
MVIGPEFCVNPQFRDTWVTYDVTPVSDTMLIALNGQEWKNVDWTNQPRPATTFRGYSYSRGGLHSINGSISLSRSSFNPDSLWYLPDL